MFPEKEEKQHDVVLNINSPRSNGIFGTDQTPTPTGLYKNCEEYGIFEDLKHVNPFEEIFRHAVEGKTILVEKAQKSPEIQDEGSLHTPQVFPQIESPTTKNVTIARAQSSSSDLTTPTPTIINELPAKEITNKPLQQTVIKKYKPIAEKPSASNTEHTLTVNFGDAIVKATGITSTIGTVIPIQTVKPLILPKVDTRLKPAANATSQAATFTVTSPSSASLTPTSQLPIKERLKVILNNNKSQRANACVDELTQKANNSKKVVQASREKTTKYNERCMERRRAAATRYRNKMRNEYKELKKRNAELQLENDKLRTRVTDLERQLVQKPVQNAINTTNAQLQIPPSSIHLIMNIPKLVVPTYGPPILHNPITYSVEKK